MRAPQSPSVTSAILTLHILMIVTAMTGCGVPFAGSARAGQEQVQPAVEKANLYIEMTKTMDRVSDSWDRYREWVNLKTGPTGNERYIDYGLYEVLVSDTQVEVTREAIAKAPLVPKLDEAMKRCIDAYLAVAPVLSEAAAYYDNKGYATDKAAMGQELHKKIVPLVPAFLKERDAMMPELRRFVRVVEGQEIAEMEARDGQSKAWQAANVQYTVNRVIDFFPRAKPEPMSSEIFDEQLSQIGPDTSGEKFEELMFGKVKLPEVLIDVTGMGEAMKGYAAAVAAFDQFAAENPEDLEDLKPLPKKLLEMLTALHSGLVKSGGKDFEGGGQMTQQIVQVYFDLMNNVSPIAQSRLRYLP